MSTNGQGKTHTYNKVTFNATQILPDAPEGEWEATIVAGKTKIRPTNSGDPMIVFQVRLDSAAEEQNEVFQGTTLPVFLTFFSDDSKKRRGGRMTKMTLNAISEQTGVDLGLIPAELTDPDHQLLAFVEACEGKNLTVWTQHRKNPETGETVVDVRLSKPGSFQGVSTISRDDDE